MPARGNSRKTEWGPPTPWARGGSANVSQATIDKTPTLLVHHPIREAVSINSHPELRCTSQEEFRDPCQTPPTYPTYYRVARVVQTRLTSPSTTPPRQWHHTKTQRSRQRGGLVSRPAACPPGRPGIRRMQRSMSAVRWPRAGRSRAARAWDQMPPKLSKQDPETDVWCVHSPSGARMPPAAFGSPGASSAAAMRHICLLFISQQS